MHKKRGLAKLKGRVCNIPIEAANICNNFPRLVDSNKLIVVKLKRDFNPIQDWGEQKDSLQDFLL